MFSTALELNEARSQEPKYFYTQKTKLWIHQTAPHFHLCTKSRASNYRLVPALQIFTFYFRYATYTVSAPFNTLFCSECFYLFSLFVMFLFPGAFVFKANSIGRLGLDGGCIGGRVVDTEQPPISVRLCVGGSRSRPERGGLTVEKMQVLQTAGWLRAGVQSLLDPVAPASDRQSESGLRHHRLPPDKDPYICGGRLQGENKKWLAGPRGENWNEHVALTLGLIDEGVALTHLFFFSFFVSFFCFQQCAHAM